MIAKVRRRDVDKYTKTGIKHGSLFAGIGGFDLGFDRVGIETAWQVEIDDKCSSVLAHHWPTVKKYKDVNNVGKQNLEPVDVVTGGFPCQDLSVAGKRQGLAGSRSGLWFQFHRILEELRPRWCVIENVPGLLSGCGCISCQTIARIIRIHAWIRKRKGSVKCPICVAGKRMLKSHSGRNLTKILQGLAEIGYLSAWRILDAQYFGVAQRRRRVFIVGSLGDGSCAEILFEPESLSWDSAPSREAEQKVAASLTRGSASGSGVNEPGRRREDDVNLVVWDNGQGDPNAEESETSYSLNPQMNQGIARPLAFGSTINHYDESQQTYIPVTANTLGSHHGRNDQDSLGAYVPVAQGLSENQRGELRLTPYSRQITTGGGKPGQGYPAAYGAFGVRRLTPTECERLQGFPDGWTAVNGMSDSARYRMLGNAVAVPEAEWIGRRVAKETA